MSLVQFLSSHWARFQAGLFPFLDDALGPLTPAHRSLVVILDMVQIKALVRHWSGLPGRPQAQRAALARAFIAKAAFNLANTRMLIDRLRADPVLRRLCGWSRLCQVPHEATFSRPLPSSPRPSCRKRPARRLADPNAADGADRTGHLVVRIVGLV